MLAYWGVTQRGARQHREYNVIVVPRRRRLIIDRSDVTPRATLPISSDRNSNRFAFDKPTRATPQTGPQHSGVGSGGLDTALDWARPIQCAQKPHKRTDTIQFVRSSRSNTRWYAWCLASIATAFALSRDRQVLTTPHRTKGCAGNCRRK